MTWPLQKIDLINQALALTGNNLVQVADDGSDEWLVGSAAYEASIEYMFESHNWSGITAIATPNKVALPANPTPGDTDFTDAYYMPPDCAHLIWVRIDETPVVTVIVGNQIWLNATGAVIVTAKYVSTANPDIASGNLTRTFMLALLAFVRAGIYAGLEEDSKKEQSQIQLGYKLLMEAKTRSDQQQGKRNCWNSRMAMARRGRRPWPQQPPPWGGTGRTE